MPISAVVVRPEVWDDRFGLLHSSTFANNNLACAAANATLDLILDDDRAFIKDIAQNGDYFQEQLEALKDRYPGVLIDVRGRGYMRALEFRAGLGMRRAEPWGLPHAHAAPCDA